MKNNPLGFILVPTLVFASISVVFLTAFVNLTASNFGAARNVENKERALEIAEAGIEYYRWHLAHAPTDFKDGTATSGPYIHPFYDVDGTYIGEYSLAITPPATGTTVVTIASTGKLFEAPLRTRTIRTQLAKPSWAKYAFVANDFMRFGQGTEVFGPIHSNKGIRFDGLAHNIVTSALSDDNDEDHTGNDEFGVHTHVKPPPNNSQIYTDFVSAEAPNNSVQNRSDVFLAGRQFPVPAIDFTGLTANLSQLKTDAQANGRYISNSGDDGYKIILKTNDTFDLYKVTSLESKPNQCSSGGQEQQSNALKWGIWSIKTTSFVATYAFPANGIIFVDDHLWVEGQINTARLTIAAGTFPDAQGQYRQITVNNDLKYTNYDGQDVISLISQGNVNAGLYSEDDLRIDGALVAQNGRVGRYYYDEDCESDSDGDEYIRQKITLYGIIATNDRYGFAYADGTGYQNRVIIYDNNLLYGPPPSFPLTTDQYQVISWEEI